ncbi:MAG: 3-phosphoglycerate dehydrogenase, partial [Hyphomicrobiales bacterium]|nr:3-phosphoglycerate dehydrogenase [Hyphomicrobiales bacterium]
RGAYGASAAVAAGAWPRNALMGREIAGKRLGLVGFGAIARETARRAAALGMAVAAHDPFVAADDPAWNPATGPVQSRALDALIAQSDVLSLHVPLTDRTRGLIDAAALARMPKGAILINAARGGVVDEAAVARALRSGHLGGAALDVFDREPLDAAAGAVFADVPNLILTPHIAGVTQESNVRVSAVTAQAVRRHLTER